MADSKISALTSATTPLAGTEVIATVQSGVTKKVAVSDLTAGRAVSALSVAAGNVAVSGNTVEANNTNGNLVLNSNGAGVMLINSASNPHVQKNVIGGGTNIRVSPDNSLEVFGPNAGTGVRLFTRTDAGVLNRLELQGSHVVFITSGGADGATFTSSSGDFSLNYGNLIIGTAGKGIDFSADGQAAGMTSELLDDYEEGTWSPQVAGSTSDGTFTTLATQGLYTKVGRTVHFQCYLGWSDGTGTGDLLIKGLPFTQNATSDSTPTVGFFKNIALTASNVPFAYMYAGVPYVAIWQNVVGGGAPSTVPYDASGEIILTGTYTI